MVKYLINNILDENLTLDELKIKLKYNKILIKEYDNLLLLYRNFNSEIYTSLDRECRSLIISKDTYKIIAYSCPVPIIINKINFSINNSIIYKYYEGTLLTIFFYNNKWNISSRKCLNEGLQYNLFCETIKDIDFYVHLNKDYIYNFILIHYQDKQIINYENIFGSEYKKLCLISIKDNEMNELSLNLNVDINIFNNIIFIQERLSNSEQNNTETEINVNDNTEPEINDNTNDNTNDEINDNDNDNDNTEHEINVNDNIEHKINDNTEHEINDNTEHKINNNDNDNTEHEINVNDNTDPIIINKDGKLYKLINQDYQFKLLNSKNIYLGMIYKYQLNKLDSKLKILNYNAIGIISLLLKFLSKKYLVMYTFYYNIYNGNKNLNSMKNYNSLNIEYKNLLYNLRGIYFKNKLIHEKYIYNYLKNLETVKLFNLICHVENIDNKLINEIIHEFNLIN